MGNPDKRVLQQEMIKVPGGMGEVFVISPQTMEDLEEGRALLAREVLEKEGMFFQVTPPSLKIEERFRKWLQEARAALKR